MGVMADKTIFVPEVISPNNTAYYSLKFLMNRFSVANDSSYHCMLTIFLYQTAMQHYCHNIFNHNNFNL